MLKVTNAPAADPALTPSQRTAVENAKKLLAAAPAIVIRSPGGVGCSTVMRSIARAFGGRVVTLSDALAWSQSRGVIRTDEAIQRCVEYHIGHYPLVAIDNFESIFHPGGRGTREVPGIRSILLRSLYQAARARGTKLVIGGKSANVYGNRLEDLANCPEALILKVDELTAEDYRTVLANLLGERATSSVDFKVVHRSVPGLSGHQLRILCNFLAAVPALTTDDVLRVIEQHLIKGNVRLGEVEQLSFDELPGTGDIAASLESQVVLPILNAELSERLQLRAKRGVLLYGPPGTGKTSIGRALAHRMRGRFFMIDGTFVTEPPNAFFSKVRNVVERAIEGSPSVLFIDDADVLFNIEHIAGLARYLLTLLDGLETESTSKVCVMMTAMDPRKVPSALLRSGRVELWLQTKLPDEAARAGILRRWVGDAFAEIGAPDFARIAAVTQSYTPADLRRVVGDAKLLCAADVAASQPLESATTYLERAVEDLSAARWRMADLRSDENIRIGGQPKGKYALGVGGLSEIGVGCKMNGW